MSTFKYYKNGQWNEVGGNIAGDTLPIGAIVPFGGWDAPTGWLICDGTLLNKTAYPELFNAIGYSFGGEEGGSTFGLPDLRGRVPVGLKETDTDFDGMGVTGGSKYLQAHRHEEIDSNYGGELSSFTTAGTKAVYDLGSLYQENKRKNSTMMTGIAGTGDSGNLQPYQTVNYIIKAKQSAGVVGNVSNIESSSQTDTYSCEYINDVESNLDTKINTLAKSVTFNNEWRIAYKPSAGNFVTTIPINNPEKKSVSFSTGFTVEIYMNGWQTCTFNTAYYLETELCIRIILPSGITLTDGNVYLIRMKGTVTVND